MSRARKTLREARTDGAARKLWADACDCLNLCDYRVSFS